MVGRTHQVKSELAGLDGGKPVSKQQVLRPSEHVTHSGAMQATAFDVEAERRAMKYQTLDSVQTMIGKGCGKP